MFTVGTQMNTMMSDGDITRTKRWLLWHIQKVFMWIQNFESHSIIGNF
jgi:hypothetical protein